MAIEHPFQGLFETFGRLPSVHAESVNRQAYERLWQVLAVGTDHAGRCILLKAPRAGHGKTHLLSRVQYNLGTEHEFIPLHAASGSFIDSSSVTADVLSRLCRPLPAGGGLCVLDLLVRKLFALALQPLVRSGEVPCQDREGALAALRNRPVETFDFHHPNAVTAHWARENFEVLGPRLALELSQRTGAPLREVMFWVDAFFRFAVTAVEHPSRAGSLIQVVSSSTVQPAQEFERLGALLGMLTRLVRVVLVADDLEGFSSDESAALRFGSFLGSLRHSAERVDAILSINRDVWESAFIPRLSGGLADRLSEVVIELEPLNREEVVALLDARAIGLGERVFARLDLSNGERHARGIIRAAADAWLKALRPVDPLEEPPSFQPQTVEVAPAAVVTPPVEVATIAATAPPEPAAAPAVVLQAQSAPPVWTPPPVVPPGSSPFTAWASGGSNPVPEPVLIPEPVMVETAANHDFLPTVEPILETASGTIPSLFDPPPPAPVFQEAVEVVPVGRIVSDDGLASSSYQESPAFTSTIEPPVEVFSQPPAFAVSPPVFNLRAETRSPFQPEHPARKPPSMEAATWPTFVSDSPFQSKASIQPAGVAEAPPAPPVQPPVHGQQASFAQPVAEPVVETRPALGEPKETDRVDELLRQFRERYARG